MKMAICAATMHHAPDGWDLNRVQIPQIFSIEEPGDIPGVMLNATTDPLLYVKYNTSGNNTGILGSYQILYKEAEEDILCFIHDDVIIHEKGWDERVIEEFEEHSCGLVGFGGALWHGTPDLYKVPYVLQNLRRGDYRSNTDDAEVHGERFTGSCDVAVLDGFCLIVRRSLLERIGGFSAFGTGFFCYDYELCALARRFQYRIRCVGIRCHHRGGSSSTQMAGSPLVSQEEYDRSHRWFYDNFRDVMPAREK